MLCMQWFARSCFVSAKARRENWDISSSVACESGSTQLLLDAQDWFVAFCLLSVLFRR